MDEGSKKERVSGLVAAEAALRRASVAKRFPPSPFDIREACPIVFRDLPEGDFNCPPGWLPLVEGLALAIEAVAKAAPEPPRCTCIKEKFGGLRFYMTDYPYPLDALIETAEASSFHTCQDCGGPGERRPGSWIRTLCNGCHAKRSATP